MKKIILEQLKEASSYLSKYSTLSSIGKLDLDQLNRDNSILDFDSTDNETSNNQVPIQFYQNMLINVAERVSTVVEAISNTMLSQNKLQYSIRYEMIEKLMQELIPTLLSLAWLVPIAASSLKIVGNAIQEQLISGAEHLILVIVDLIDETDKILNIYQQKEHKLKALFVSSKERSTELDKEKAMLRTIINTVIQVFLVFLDRIQKAETLVSMVRDTPGCLLNVSQDPYAVTGSYKSKEKRVSLGEIVLPKAASDQIYAKWEKKQDGSNNPSSSSSGNEVLPIYQELRRASMLEKMKEHSVPRQEKHVSLPPSYENMQKIAEGLELLSKLDSKHEYEIIDRRETTENEASEERKFRPQNIVSDVLLTKLNGWFKKTSTRGQMILTNSYVIIQQITKDQQQKSTPPKIKPVIVERIENFNPTLEEESNTLILSSNGKNTAKQRQQQLQIRFEKESAAIWLNILLHLQDEIKINA